ACNGKDCSSKFLRTRRVYRSPFGDGRTEPALVGGPAPRTRRGAGGKAAKRLRGRTLDGILVRGYTRGQVVEPPDHEKPARRGWPDAKGNAARSANGECLPRWRSTFDFSPIIFR